jgi:hypothetical protein
LALGPRGWWKEEEVKKRWGMGLKKRRQEM